ncbi:MAG: nucleoside deaminase [Cyanobacteria bacterium RUI128]|nr:nucleoside deaminase [Cyanobacteria bacterium RUI128]
MDYSKEHNKLFERAIREAKQTSSKDVPVGCAILKDGVIIAAAHNQKEELADVTGHAEIIALRDVQKKLGTWRLDECDMYVTLEPCPMCAWAIISSGVKKLYFGSYNTQCGAFGTVMDLRKTANSKLVVYGGIEEEKCDKILNKFFENLRLSDKGN